jgi:hypothetical protein
MTLTEILLFVLLLATIIWVGGAIVGTLLGGQLRRGDDASALAAFCAGFSNVAAPLFGASALVVLGTGLGIVLQDGGPAFGDGWVLATFACWLVGMLLGATFVGWTWTKISTDLNGGATLADVQPRVSRATLLTWLDAAVLLLGVLLAVWQPGA